MTEGGSDAGDSVNGTFSVARDFWDDPVFSPQTFTEREAFLWLIAQAAVITPTILRTPGGDLKLKRGEVAASQRLMAERWQWSKGDVHRFMVKLKDAGKLIMTKQVGAVKSEKLGAVPAVFFIKNFNKYQLDASEIWGRGNGAYLGQGSANKGFPPKNPLSKYRNSNHKGDSNGSLSSEDSPKLPLNEDSKPLEVTRAREPSAAQGRSFIPDGFQPDLNAATAYWQKRGRDDLIPFVNDEAETFKAHHTAHNTRSASWPGSWRTWYVRTPQLNPVRQRQRSGEPRHRLVSIFDEEGKHGPH